MNTRKAVALYIVHYWKKNCCLLIPSKDRLCNKASLAISDVLLVKRPQHQLEREGAGGRSLVGVHSYNVGFDGRRQAG